MNTMTLTKREKIGGNRRENGTDLTDLKVKQEQAILALVSTGTITDAAKAAGISESTLYRWLDEVDFQAAYRKVRSQIVRASLARLRQTLCSGIGTLEEIMSDPNNPPGARITAVQTIFQMVLNTREFQEYWE